MYFNPFFKEAIFRLRQVDLKLKGIFQAFNLLEVSTGFFNKFEFAKSVIFINAFMCFILLLGV